MTHEYTLDFLQSLKKKSLIDICKNYNIKNISNKKKTDIINIILSYENNSDIIYPQSILNNIHFEKIHHLSDIHIRPLKRHDEYNEVFQNVYSILKQSKTSDLIVVSGDILHEKDNLKPETVLIVRNFMKELSKYGTVIVITGNHDMLENNSDRIDNLTAILDDLNIYYLVKSGAYVFGNVIISVSSLVDKKFIKHSQIQNNNNLPIICLYHGSINGSVTDTGHIIDDQKYGYSTRFRKISDFDGYYLTLLGDIHKKQFLKPNIGYCGSLIQQNFGEKIDNHGFLTWDIKTRNVHFNKVKNRYGFINIIIDNEKWSYPDIIPEKPYVRLLLKNTDISYSEIVKEQIEEKFDVKLFKVNDISDIDINIPEDIQYHSDDIDILNEEMKLLKYDEEKIKNILDIHTSLKDKCDTEKLNIMMNCESWELIKLSFKNVFIFGGNKINTIDFKKINGVITIVGNNAIGKSNLINIITYILYGISDDFKAPHVLNQYENDFLIECDILIGSILYKIKKIGKRRKGNKINLSLSLYKYDNGWIKQDGENNKKTISYIKLLLGNVNEFLLTNVYSNSSLKSILAQSNSERHKTLSNLFCLDIYEQLEKEAKKKINILQSEYTSLKGNYDGLSYNINFDDINNINTNINNINNKLVELSCELKEILNSKNKIESYLDINEKITFNNINFTDTKKQLNLCINILKSKYNNDYSCNYNINDLIIEKNILKSKIITTTNTLNDIDNNKLTDDYFNNLKNKMNILQSEIYSIYIKNIPEIKNISLQEIKEKYDFSDNNLSFQDINNKIINKKSIINNIKFDKEPVELFNYDHNINIEKLNKALKKKEKITLKIEDNNRYLKHINNSDYLFEYDDMKDLKIKFDDKIKKLKSNIKQVYILPQTDIQIVKSRLLNNPLLINNIDNIITNHKNKEDLIDYLTSIKKSLIDKNILDDIQHINLYKLNEEIISKNISIEKEINDISYFYYSECNKLLNSLLLKVINNINKYEDKKYSYYYSIYEEVIRLEHLLAYNSLLEKEENDINIEKRNKKLSEYNELKITLEKDLLLKEQYDIYQNNILIKKEINILDTKIEHQSVIDKYNKYKNILDNQKIYEKVLVYKEELLVVNKRYLDIEVLISSYKKDIITLKDKKENILKIKDKCDLIQNKMTDISNNINIYKEYCILVNKNNIPTKLIKKKIINIQNHVNIYLKSLTSFSLKIEIDKKNKINFIIQKNNLNFDIEQLSGYETFILNISIKSSLNKYSFISKSKLFIIDEGLDVVDNQNFKKLNMFMELLKKNYKHILLISHISKIKNFSNHSINISNNNKYSIID